MQAVLGGRVMKPRFHDYKIQYGMKSYFNEELTRQNQNNVFIENAGIYKRGEKEGFQEYDFNNANFWIYYLEENLVKQTNNKVSLYDFHGEDGVFSDLIENLDPESLTKLQQLFLMFDKNTQKAQRLNYFSDPSSTLIDKYDLWKAMDFENQIEIVTSQDEDLGIAILKYIYGLYNKETVAVQKEQLNNIQFKLFSSSTINKERFNQVTEMQLKVWNEILTVEDQYMLWFEIFKAQDRVRLWNSLVFSENYFNYVAYSPKFKREDIKIIMSKINAESKTQMYLLCTSPNKY